MIGVLRRLLQDESAAAMTEYALVLSLLSGPAMAALILLANGSSDALAKASSAMTNFQLETPPQ